MDSSKQRDGKTEYHVALGGMMQYWAGTWSKEAASSWRMWLVFDLITIAITITIRYAKFHDVPHNFFMGDVGEVGGDSRIGAEVAA